MDWEKIKPVLWGADSAACGCIVTRLMAWRRLDRGFVGTTVCVGHADTLQVVYAS
jgi:hypothetical protein